MKEQPGQYTLETDMDRTHKRNEGKVQPLDVASGETQPEAGEQDRKGEQSKTECV